MKTTHEIADAMAGRAAEKAYAHKAATVDDFKAAVVEQIPLLELLEVARAAKAVDSCQEALSWCDSNANWMQKRDLDKALEQQSEALSQLKDKLPEM